MAHSRSRDEKRPKNERRQGLFLKFKEIIWRNGKPRVHWKKFCPKLTQNVRSEIMSRTPDFK